MKKQLLFIASLLWVGSAAAQFAPGIEAQAYPAGQIVVATFKIPVPFFAEYRVHAGYNRTRRQDWGEHDDERGYGIGVGADVTRVFGNGGSGFVFSLRMDLWRLDIDWTDSELVDPPASGSSQVTVAQPTARAGYRLSAGLVTLDALVGLGAEMNIHTKGDEVGQGLILLGGLRLSL